MVLADVLFGWTPVVSWDGPQALICGICALLAFRHLPCPTRLGVPSVSEWLICIAHGRVLVVVML